MNKGANFRLCHHLKPSSVLDGLEDDLIYLLISGVRNRMKIKRVFKVGRI